MGRVLTCLRLCMVACCVQTYTRLCQQCVRICCVCGRHTSRFLMCYILIGLPLLLWPLAGWSSPVLAVLISFLLLGVENIGAFIEEPFHVSN